MMDRKEILCNFKQCIEEHQSHHETDKESMKITDDWDEFLENGHSKRGFLHYENPEYKNWVLIPSYLSESDREQVIEIKREIYSFSSELDNILLNFIDCAEQNYCTDSEVFSALLGAMEYVEEYHDMKMREVFARLGEYAISQRMLKSDYTSWHLTLRLERSFLLNEIMFARMLLYNLLDRDEKQANKISGIIDMDSLIEKEIKIRASNRYLECPCSIEFVYNNKMLQQGVKDFMMIMRWEEDNVDTEKCESKE